MDLDLRTVSVVVALAYVLQTIALGFLYSKNKKFTAIFWWALGSGLTALGFLLFLVRDFIQLALISIILPNALVVAGSIGIYLGIMLFLERRANKGLVSLVFGLFIALYFYFTYVNNDINSRTVIVSVALVFYLLLTAWELLEKPAKAIASSLYFIAAVMVFEACFLLFRTVSVLTFAPVQTLFTPTLIQTLVFVVYFVEGILVTFGLIFLVNQRLNAEKTDAKDHFEIIFDTNPDGVVISRLDNGIVVDINEGVTNLTGFTRDDVIGSSLFDTRFWKNPADIPAVVNEFRKKGQFENIELVILRKDGSEIAGIASARMITLHDVPHILSVIRDITERKYNEEIIGLSNTVYEISSASSDLPSMLNEYTAFIREYTGCEAVGVRILDTEGYIPYEANIGFPEEFVRRESPLSIKFDQCMCIYVIQGTTDPSLPFFTDGGSFYMNTTTKFLATVSEEEKGKTRNACNQVGFESVALVPLRKGDEILGLLHLADRREGMVPVRTVKILENVTRAMGSPIMRMKAEDQLRNKNTDLNALNEELTATHEELRQNIDDLNRSEEVLRQNEEQLKTALAEKEILLAEIHHRVKNNLTAFISLLSLEGSTEETDDGKKLKLDLQNRARSMALVHETLYRTHLYNEVDMDMYLTTLLDQIVASIQTSRTVKEVIDAHGVMVDIPRATPLGLIVNELVTNSMKYAFPESFDVQSGDAPTISVTLAKTNGLYELTVRDNGVGLPPGFDVAGTQTLGLKLVNFLARHQLRAKIEVNTEDGTEFIFRFKE